MSRPAANSVGRRNANVAIRSQHAKEHSMAKIAGPFTMPDANAAMIHLVARISWADVWAE